MLGTPQSEDAAVFSTPDHPTHILGSAVSECGRFLWLTSTEGCDPRNKLYYIDLHALAASGAPLSAAAAPVVKLVDDFVASWDPIVVDGTQLVLQTNLDAPRYRVVRVDLADAPSVAAGPSAWRSLVPQQPEAGGWGVLEWAAAAAGDALVLCYSKDAHHSLQLHSLESGELVAPVALPSLGSVSGASVKREDAAIFFGFTSFLDPGAVYSLDTATPGAKPALVRRSAVSGFDPDAYECALWIAHSSLIVYEPLTRA